MQRDAEATKRRLIAAGRAEFAAFGLNGARVDRIALAAQCNKAQIYHYFTNKEGLFDAVWNSHVQQIVSSLPRDVTDLPDFAAHLYDLYSEHPELPRLITWQRLERGHGPLSKEGVEDVRQKSAAIAEAQAAGIISNRFDARVLQALVIHIAMLWDASAPEVLTVVDVEDQAQRREVVRKVIAALIS